MSNLVSIHILYEDQDLEIDVEPDMELEDLLDCIRILGLSDVTQLEQFDEELGRWTAVSKTVDLQLKNGAKYKVMPQEVYILHKIWRDISRADSLWQDNNFFKPMQVKYLVTADNLYWLLLLSMCMINAV